MAAYIFLASLFLRLRRHPGGLDTQPDVGTAGMMVASGQHSTLWLCLLKGPGFKFQLNILLYSC